MRQSFVAQLIYSLLLRMVAHFRAGLGPLTSEDAKLHTLMHFVDFLAIALWCNGELPPVYCLLNQILLFSFKIEGNENLNHDYSIKISRTFRNIFIFEAIIISQK